MAGEQVQTEQETHFAFTFNTVTEYAGNSRTNVAPKPSTVSVRGTILFGSVMELVSSRWLAARTTAWPLGLIAFVPLIWTLIRWALPAVFTTFR